MINEQLCREATLGVNYSFQKRLDRHYCTNYFTSLGSVPNSLTHTREQTPGLTEADRALIKAEIVCDSLVLPSTPQGFSSQRRKLSSISFWPQAWPSIDPPEFQETVRSPPSCKCLLNIDRDRTQSELLFYPSSMQGLNTHHLFLHPSLTHSFTLSLPRSPTCPLSPAHSLPHPSTHSPTRSPTHSFIDSLTWSPVHFFTLSECIL